MPIRIKSYNEYLGDMARKIVADTAINDIQPGSAIMSLLEAIASNDFDNGVAILTVLQMSNIDAIKDNDLDAKAAELGLSRLTAIKASGFVTISDTTITKLSSTLYQLKSAPVRGATKLYVNDAADWALTGDLYIGRGTPSFEGPIAYTNITDNGTFFTVDLASSLQNDHLISDVVVNGQGTSNRLIPAGTQVLIKANNVAPQINYITLRDAVIPAGEDSVDSVDIIATISGSSSNAGINTIVDFATLPFDGAAVTNPSPLINGRDLESDDTFRNRIKSYASTLARGTKDAILASVVGVSDPNDGKQVVSAVITEPVSSTDPSILYIDDGTGFQPSYAGQSVDTLISSATGKEEFLQLANYPLPRPQVVNTADGPYELQDGFTLTVSVDSQEETITFSASQFVSIASASVAEVVVAINDQATLFRCRMTQNSTRLLVYPVYHGAEVIRVVPPRTASEELVSANNILKFSTDEVSYIKLYRNDTLMQQRSSSATVLSSSLSTWNIFSSGNLAIEVDGTPAQDRTFTLADFSAASFASLGLDDWARVFNLKFAGITASTTPSGSLQLVSNKGSASSSIKVVGGTYAPKMFSGVATEAVGQTSDFNINRQNGVVQLNFVPNAGDTISAGLQDTKGPVTSLAATSGQYNLSTDAFSRPPEVVMVADDTSVVIRPLQVLLNSWIQVDDMGSSVMRLTANATGNFYQIVPGDYLYIANRGDIDGSGTGPWLDKRDCGLFKVIAKGEHLTAGLDTWVEVINVGMVALGSDQQYVVQAAEDIQAFKAEVLPQVWSGLLLPVPATALISDVVASINSRVSGVHASVYKTNFVKVTSTTERTGSIAIPVSIGNAKLLFATGSNAVTGNLPHAAVTAMSDDLSAGLRRGPAATQTVWLDRDAYGALVGTPSDDVEPGTQGLDPYAAVLRSPGTLEFAKESDLVAVSEGSNVGELRPVRHILTDYKVGTQFSLPATKMDYDAGTTVLDVVRPLGVSSEDSAVFVVDGDSVAKTIEIPMNRLGKVNSGSVGTFTPTSRAFSANDADNEPGVTFSSAQVWSKTLSDAEFQDYAVWFRSRNWYASGGVGSGGGSMLVRAAEFGPIGDSVRFKIEYPSLPGSDADFLVDNTPKTTTLTYLFGSGTERSTGLVAGQQFSVSALGSDMYRLTFQPFVPLINLNTVQVGDVLSIGSDPGISFDNRGTFRVANVNAGSSYVDIHNPNAAITGVGAVEITDVTTVADVVGAFNETTITTVPGATLDGTYFILEESAGKLKIWFDLTGSTPEPTVPGTVRSVRVADVVAGDTANQVASKLTGIISAYSEYAATVFGNVINAVSRVTGARTLSVAGTSGFTPGTVTVGSASTTLDGTYFMLNDANGTVKVWFNLSGTTPEPAALASRSVQISTVAFGDSANTVATRIATELVSDPMFSVSVLGNVVTITDTLVGARPDASAGTSGFTVVPTQQGVNSVNETVGIPSLLKFFPITDTAVSAIQTVVNQSNVVKITGLGNVSLTIPYATRDEVYTIGGPVTAPLAYNHDPAPGSLLNDHVALWDGEAHVDVFSNSDPNFVLKGTLVMSASAPQIYSLDTGPNQDTLDIGEYFYLLPRTPANALHHMTHRALSQLPIVTDVDLVDRCRKLQIRSKKLGSAGSIEVVGGEAISAQKFIEKEASASVVDAVGYMELSVPLLPASVSPGDVVEIKNDFGVQRLNRYAPGDKIDVVKFSDTQYRFENQPRISSPSPHVKLTVTDVSSLHGRTSSSVWRWTHSDSGSYLNITDRTPGAPPEVLVDLVANGTSDSPQLHEDLLVAGVPSVAQIFRLTVSGMPAQADHYAFSSADGATFAVWLDIVATLLDVPGVPPTSACYLAASNQIRVPILASYTDNQIVNAISTALAADTPFVTSFQSAVTAPFSFEGARPGDLLVALGSLGTGWLSCNRTLTVGDDRIAGFPIVEVNSSAGYVDVASPTIRAMSDVKVQTGTFAVTPTPSIRWELAHGAKVDFVSISVSVLGVATAITSSPHRLSEGDTFSVEDTTAIPSGPVIDVQGFNQFTFNTSAPFGSYSGGRLLASAVTPTSYKIVPVGVNGLVRLSAMSGDSPNFVDSGVAVDDLLIISGNTFKSANLGTYRVLAVDNNSVIYANENAVTETATMTDFNGTESSVIWTANSDRVVSSSGLPGAFENLSVGMWVKKIEDSDDKYRQVLAFLDAVGTPTSAVSAVQIQLADLYRGFTATTLGIGFNQATSASSGVQLLSTDDIAVYEGDSTRANDVLRISNLLAPSWFLQNNVGNFTVGQLGSTDSGKTFMRVTNTQGQAQVGAVIPTDGSGFAIYESDAHTFSTRREVYRTAVDEVDPNRRTIYVTPASRAYKFSPANSTSINAVGKMSFDVAVTTGVDGYLYNTGLLRTVQRTVDGFEPNPEEFPGHKAVGGTIEIMPPLIKKVKISLTVTTGEGININDVSNEAKSAIINYVNNLKVAEDVILSRIVVAVMGIKGVDAVTFVSPSPGTERVFVNDGEKALIEAQDISIS